MSSWTRQEWQRFAVSLSAVLFILGIFLGNSYTDLKDKGFFQAWGPLGAPSARPVEILSASYTQISVKADSGDIYTRCTKYCPYDSRYPQANWVPATGSFKEYDQSQNPGFDQPLAKQPPSKAIDTVKFQVSSPEMTFDVQYAITEDGTVWRWESGSGISPVLYGKCIFPILGLVIGLLISFGLHSHFKEEVEQVTS